MRHGERRSLHPRGPAWTRALRRRPGRRGPRGGGGAGRPSRSRRRLELGGGNGPSDPDRAGPGLLGAIVGASQHNPYEETEEARSRAEKLDVDSIVAVGGGSAIGLAKAIAVAAKVPIVAVPTTCSGSEMTPIWGVTRAGTKTTGRDPAALPRTVV